MAISKKHPTCILGAELKAARFFAFKSYSKTSNRWNAIKGGFDGVDALKSQPVVPDEFGVKCRRSLVWPEFLKILWAFEREVALEEEAVYRGLRQKGLGLVLLLGVEYLAEVKTRQKHHWECLVTQRNAPPLWDLQSVFAQGGDDEAQMVGQGLRWRVEAVLERRTDYVRGKECVSGLGCREVGFIGKHGQNPKLV